MTIHNRVRIPFKRNVTAELVTFDLPHDDKDHFAVLFDGWNQSDTPLVRIHSECITGDVFGSRLCDCGLQLKESFNHFADGGGILLYLRQEGRGIGLKNKIDAYELQQKFGLDTFTANRALGHRNDERSYDVAAQMLTDLGVNRVRLLSNNPDKMRQLIENGVEITEFVQTKLHLNPRNRRYIEAKRTMGHLFPEIA
jgi:GTP cyclohydrolase II